MLYTIAVIYCIASIILWFKRKFRVGNYSEKYVFITGCDTGFGYLLAKRLDGLGFYVFAGCLTENGADRLKHDCSANLQTLIMDVRNENSIANAVDVVRQELPNGRGLWALVNNAGIGGSPCPLEWLKKEDFEQCLAVNLYGYILVTKAFLPLVRRARGRIVNMSSFAGRIGTLAHPYAISKYGVEAFSCCLRNELLATGVSVHVIEPSFYSTNINSLESARKHYETSFMNLDEETREYYGEEFMDLRISGQEAALKLVMSSNLDDVVDAYEHAVTAKYPKCRYLVGPFASRVVFWILYWLPDWFTWKILYSKSPAPKGLVVPNK